MPAARLAFSLFIGRQAKGLTVADTPWGWGRGLSSQVRWDELRNVEFMVNGSRCTIYTAFYGSQDVVAKVMRKDVKDKEAVQKVNSLRNGYSTQVEQSKSLSPCAHL